MTERLEEIEKNLDPLGYGMGGHLIGVNDIYWLVGSHCRDSPVYLPYGPGRSLCTQH